MSQNYILPKPVLSFDRIDGEGWYWASEPINYRLHGGSITIPPLFMSDGASIPKVFQSVFSKTGRYLHAAILHDWLYKADCPNRLTRKQSDKMFLHYMRLYGVGWLTRHTIYRALRIGGWGAWRKRPAQYYEFSMARECGLPE